MRDFDSVPPSAPYGSIEPPSARETVSDAQSVPPARHALSRLLAAVVLSAAAIVVFTAEPPESAAAAADRDAADAFDATPRGGARADAAPRASSTARGARADAVGSAQTAGGVRAPSFELYKHALSVKAGSSGDIVQFVNATLAHLDPNFDLGCDGVKVNAYLLPYGPQLHWVDAKQLSNDPRPIEEWQPRFEALNADMSKFNAFMHNKVQLFVPELGDGLLAALENSGAPLMFRVSKGYTYDAQPNDDGSTSADVAHVLFPIAGRVYEVAAPVTAAIAERAAEWPEWAADECEVSHRLDTDLDSYADEYASYVGEARELYTSMSAWADERGYFPPMLASISVAADSEHDGTQFPGGQLYQDLERFAEVPSYAEAELDEGCGVTRIDTVSSNGGFAAPVRYVTNRAKNAELEERAGSSSAPTVAEYNGYIAKTHDTITNGKYEFWSGWDHWLDQHIGLKYVGDEPCGRTNSLNGNLSASGPPIGQRTTADYGSEKATHWYTGYPGSVSWEYWVIGCDYGSFNNDADVCACVDSNNDKFFLADTGLNCSSYGLGEWLHGSAPDADDAA